MTFLKLLIFFSLTFFFSAMGATAECSYRTGEHIREINKPSNIKKIDIEVSKSAKFAKNFMRIVNSGTENIPSDLKKPFKATIRVEYSFGHCIFKGEVKQNGDWKDHISFNRGKPIRSLNVKLFEGNISNAVRFKLLIPETRNNLSEIFAVSVLRNFDVITPETFKVMVGLNGVESEMLFQEQARKELLERNMRREGPIFEGDESLLWGDGMIVDNDTVSLSRMVNENWFLKGSSSRAISLAAYGRLQKAYISRAEHKTNDFIQPNAQHTREFHKYHFLMIALQGEHGLAPHNRKYYFNSFLDDFEPIYYDGDVMGKKGLELDSEVLKYIPADTWRSSVAKIRDDQTKKAAHKYFIERTNISEKQSMKIFENLWTDFGLNIEKVVSKLESLKGISENKSVSTYDEFLTRAEKLLKNTNFITKINETENDTYNVKMSSGLKSEVGIKELSSIISRNKFKQLRATLIDYNVRPRLKNEKSFNFNNGKVFFSNGITIKFDQVSRHIKIWQKSSNDWVYFFGVNLDGWKITFNGLSGEIKSDLQRFNELGLTGCLNFYQSKFKNADIIVQKGACEDSLNIVKSSGHIKTITVNTAAADAIDLDFSNLHLENVHVNAAKNDCIDVSGGHYRINSLQGTYCTDKFISVGEKSFFVAEKIQSQDALIGVSAKDMSVVTLHNGIINHVGKCFEAFQKKQEFGGGELNLGNIKCDGEIDIDEKSKLNRFN